MMALKTSHLSKTISRLLLLAVTITAIAIQSAHAQTSNRPEGIAYPDTIATGGTPPDPGKPITAGRMVSGPEHKLINQVKTKADVQRDSGDLKKLLDDAKARKGKDQMTSKYQWGASAVDFAKNTADDAWQLAGDAHLGRFMDCLSFRIIGVCWDIQLWPPWDMHFKWSLVKTYRWPLQSMEVVKDRGVSAYVIRDIPDRLIAIPKNKSPISFVPMTLKYGTKLGDDVLRADSQSNVSKLLKIGSFTQLLRSDMKLSFAALGPESLAKSIPAALGVPKNRLPAGLPKGSLPSAGKRRGINFATPADKTFKDYEYHDKDDKKITDVINYDKKVKDSNDEKPFDEIEERFKNTTNPTQGNITTEYRVHPSYAGEAVQKLWNKSVAPVIQATVNTVQNTVITTLCSLFGPLAAACELVAPRAVDTANLCHKSKFPPHYFSELPNGILQSRFVTANLLVPDLFVPTLQKIVNPMGCALSYMRSNSGGETRTDAEVNMFEKLSAQNLGLEGGATGYCLRGGLNNPFPVLNTTLQAEYSSGSEVGILKAIWAARAWGDIVDPPTQFCFGPWCFDVIDHNPYYNYDTRPDFDTLQWTHDEEMPKDCLDQLEDSRTGTKWDSTGNSWRRYYFENDENKNNNYDIHKIEWSDGHWDDYWNVAYLWRRIICCPFSDRGCPGIFPFGDAPDGQCDDTSDSMYVSTYQDNTSP